MTKRFLWTIVGAVLCAGASTMTAADAPDEWVCNTDTQQGTCDINKPIVVRKSRPRAEDEVRHLVKKARFLIDYKGSGIHYTVRLLSKHWLLGFKGATFEWKPVLDNENNPVLMPDYVCKDLSKSSAKVMKSGKFSETGEFTPPNFSHFTTVDAIPLHPYDDGQGEQKHHWLIFPIGDTVTNENRDYCLMIPPEAADGGSHDGAVHGDS
jgi:hypothetical protein